MGQWAIALPWGCEWSVVRPRQGHTGGWTPKQVVPGLVASGPGGRGLAGVVSAKALLPLLSPAPASAQVVAALGVVEVVALSAARKLVPNRHQEVADAGRTAP